MKFTTQLLMLSLVSCAHEQPAKYFNTGDTIINNISPMDTIGRDDPVYKSVVKIVDNEKGVIGAGFIIDNVNNNSYILSVQHICLRRGRKLEASSVPGKHLSLIHISEPTRPY